MPFVEEYKGSELQYRQPLKTGFTYNPKIDSPKPGAETTGYYDFRPSPLKRTYVLILQQRAETQKCGETSESRNVATFGRATPATLAIGKHKAALIPSRTTSLAKSDAGKFKPSAFRGFVGFTKLGYETEKALFPL
jgi:hypothetical protein